jgi:hypothetical protein
MASSPYVAAYLGGREDVGVLVEKIANAAHRRPTTR